MVVLAVVAILAVLAPPAYLDWAARSELRKAITEVSTTLNFSKIAARNRNSTVTVTVQKVGSNVQVSAGGLVPAISMGTHVTTIVGGGPVAIQFSRLGLLVGGAAQQVALTNSRGLTYSVAVTPAGK